MDFSNQDRICTFSKVMHQRKTY